MQDSKQRTTAQNRALWLMFTQLAVDLNDRGLYMQRVLKSSVDIMWNKDNVHDYLWIPVQEAITGTSSTTSLETKEIDKVFETLVNHLGTKFGIELEFPSIESLMNKKGLR